MNKPSAFALANRACWSGIEYSAAPMTAFDLIAVEEALERRRNPWITIVCERQNARTFIIAGDIVLRLCWEYCQKWNLTITRSGDSWFSKVSKKIAINSDLRQSSSVEFDTGVAKLDEERRWWMSIFNLHTEQSWLQIRRIPNNGKSCQVTNEEVVGFVVWSCFTVLQSAVTSAMSRLSSHNIL